MSRAHRHDVGVEAAPQKGDIAQNIEDLVADELVFEPEGLLGEDFVPLDDDRAVEAATLNFPEFEEFLNILVDSEGAGRGDLGDVGIRIDIEGQVLGVDAPVVGGSAGDFQGLTGEGDDRAVPFGNRNGFL